MAEIAAKDPLAVGMRLLRVHANAVKIQRWFRTKRKARMALAPLRAAVIIQRAFYRFKAFRDRLFRKVAASGAQHLYLLPRFEPIVQRVLQKALRQLAAERAAKAGPGAAPQPQMEKVSQPMRYTNIMITAPAEKWNPLVDVPQGIAVREVHYNRTLGDLFTLNKLRIGTLN